MLAKKSIIDQVNLQKDSINESKLEIDEQINNRKLLYAYEEQNLAGSQTKEAKAFIDLVADLFYGKDVQDIINRALGDDSISAARVVIDDKTENLTESDMAVVLRFFNDKNNLKFTWESADNVKKDWDTSLIDLAQENLTESEKIADCSMLRHLVMTNKNKSFYTSTIDKTEFNTLLTSYCDEDIVQLLSSTVDSIFTKYIDNSTEYTLTLGAKDILNLDMQINSIISNLKFLESQSNDYQEQLSKLQYTIAQYEAQLPLYYLYNDSCIYGFARTSLENVFRLNYISDNYENTIAINYDLGTFDNGEYQNPTNKIVSVIDSAENVISFNYENDLLASIVDAQDKEVKFNYVNGLLVSVTYADETKSTYEYTNNLLTHAVASNGLGAKFDYNATTKKVSKISSISQLAEIKNGKAILNTNYTTDEKFLKITYIDGNSTSIATIKNVNGTETEEKVLTYIFDRLGKVRTVYENNFNPEIPDSSNVYVKNFDYTAEKNTFTMQALLNSPNYMDDVCFGTCATEEVAVNYLGDGLIDGEEIYCGDDIYCETYTRHTDYHTMATGESTASVEMSASNLAKLQADNVKNLVASCWAKADSAFVFNNDDEVKSYSDEIMSRKFELKVLVAYTDTTSQTFSKNFDWMNTGWQYCAVPIILDKTKTIENITSTIDYSNNTGEICFSAVSIKEASFEQKVYENELLKSATSSHSKWTQTYNYDDLDKLTSLVYTNTETNETYTTEYFYNKNGKLFKTIDFNGVVNEKVYNNKGIEIQTKKYHKDNPAEILFTEQKLGEKGEVLADYNELGKEINSYDYVSGTGIVSKITDKQGNKTAYGYDTKNGALLQLTTDIDGEANTNTYGYELGFLTKVNHNDFDICYDYDHKGRVKNIAVAGSDYLTFAYDDPNNASYTYYQNGNVFETINDKNGNVTEINYKSNATAEKEAVLQNVYDTYGNLIAVNDLVTGAT
ncbi:MAG: hypothetical protein J6C13_02625, partial [Clostridia bacterium]|nr:hypothetical protein [Clostridia bacterium]